MFDHVGGRSFDQLEDIPRGTQRGLFSLYNEQRNCRYNKAYPDKQDLNLKLENVPGETDYISRDDGCEKRTNEFKKVFL